MADPRRRGRGRSGRGGRIPRRGEHGGGVTLHDETYVSFPLDVAGPIHIQSALDLDAAHGALHDTLERERRQAELLRGLVARAGDPALSDVLVQVERHRDVLEQLARDLNAEVGTGEAPGAQGDLWDLVALQRLSRLGWGLLQRLAYASGDRRIDRVVKPVLQEKERHAQVLEALGIDEAAAALVRELEV
jgi:hypothetical protein